MDPRRRTATPGPRHRGRRLPAGRRPDQHRRRTPQLHRRPHGRHPRGRRLPAPPRRRTPPRPPGAAVSSTRRASKRARLARRDENDQLRTARRDSLAVLLARLARGIAPTPDEVALLRATVEAEIRENDAARTSERGQQRAMEQQRQRVAAAEAAIRELEAERDAVNEALGLAPGQLPGTAPSAIRGRAATIREQAQRAEQAEQRAKDAEAERDELRSAYDRACKTIAAMHEAATGRTGEGPVRGVVEDVADVRALMLAAEAA